MASSAAETTDSVSTEQRRRSINSPCRRCALALRSVASPVTSGPDSSRWGEGDVISSHIRPTKPPVREQPCRS